MVNYSNGKIYKIEPICEHEEGEIYIGSTTKKYLSQRMDTHRNNYKSYKDGKRPSKVYSFILFDKYGIEQCDIILLETVNANTKDELYAREKYYITTMKCVNKNIPLRTKKEWTEDNIDKVKQHKNQWYEDNKIEILQKRKTYYNENRDTINSKNKDYYEAHKEIINQQQREYYNENKEKAQEYHQNNRNEILKKQKEYREKNKENEKLRFKEYYEKNKEQINARKREKRKQSKAKV